MEEAKPPIYKRFFIFSLFILHKDIKIQIFLGMHKQHETTLIKASSSSFIYREERKGSIVLDECNYFLYAKIVLDVLIHIITINQSCEALCLTTASGKNLSEGGNCHKKWSLLSTVSFETIYLYSE